VLELTVMNLAWKGHDFDPTFTRVLVLCALGGSMIALAGLVHLPRPAIFAVAVVMIAGHDALDLASRRQRCPRHSRRTRSRCHAGPLQPGRTVDRIGFARSDGACVA
jgi:uncharacterized membrane protein